VVQIYGGDQVARERILVIEQSADDRRFIVESVLRPAGYDVLAGTDGLEAVTLIQDLDPDVILAGSNLPGLSGLDLLRTVRTKNAHVPIILLVRDGSEQYAVEALRAGVSDYLMLPCTREQVLESVDRVLTHYWTMTISEAAPAQLLETNRRLEERLRDLETLVKVGKRVTSRLDLGYVLTQVVEAAVRLAGAEEGTLLLTDPPTGDLYLLASSNNPAAVDGTFRLPVSDSLAGQVVQTGRPLVITGEELQRIKTHYYFRNLAYIPLKVQDNVIGVLGVSNRETVGNFDEATLRMLTVLADFSAIAIENARLYTITEQERRKLDAVLNHTEDAIIIVDTVGAILFCNPAACDYFQVNFPACQGQLVRNVFANDDLLDLLEKEAQLGQSRAAEIRLSDGKRVLNGHLTVVEDVGRVVVMQDITHLKELDRIKSDFVTTVSHDLRSPLTAILGYIELLSRSGPLNANQSQFVERIVFSVQSITALLTDLLELGKIEAGFDHDREAVSMRLIVQYAVEGQRHSWETKHQVLDVQMAEDLPMVMGHPQRLRQLVNNLLENAIKYTPEGGSIAISLESESDFLVLRVTDTGIGIPQKDQPYIFDKFYRSDVAIDQYEGTGLGLSIVKGIVDQHGGRIWVDSRVGQGTTFTVMLPANGAEPASEH